MSMDSYNLEWITQYYNDKGVVAKASKRNIQCRISGGRRIHDGVAEFKHIVWNEGIDCKLYGPYDTPTVWQFATCNTDASVKLMTLLWPGLTVKKREQALKKGRINLYGDTEYSVFEHLGPADPDEAYFKTLTWKDIINDDVLARKIRDEYPHIYDDILYGVGGPFEGRPRPYDE